MLLISRGLLLNVYILWILFNVVSPAQLLQGRVSGSFPTFVSEIELRQLQSLIEGILEAQGYAGALEGLLICLVG